MASDDTMTVHSYMQEDDDDEIDDHHHRFNMSRLSMCTSNSKESDDDEDDDLTTNMSGLSVEEGSEVDADGEFSDEKDGKEIPIGLEDSDRETGWFSLPASPRRRIQSGFRTNSRRREASREYGSENEMRSNRYTRRLRERWLERAWEMKKGKAIGMDGEMEDNPSGDSECVVIARPRGGRRSLCMDMDEIKACRDLGFDLQREWMLEIPNRISGSTTIDTDSGGNSPIASWRISSPGDDPRDVKARLKVWAQAVALASASHLNG